MKPLVSVVINNYNYGRYLATAIDSALRQTYEPLEVIVVDDGSTDDSREILDGYRERITLILKPNGGQASAFNAGISRAAGAFIALLDSDDYLLPNAVEECVANFPDGYARIYHRLRIVNDEGDGVLGLPEDAYFRYFDGDIYEAVRRGRDFFWAPTSGNFFRASVLKAVLPVPEDDFRICADAYVLARTGLLGHVRSLDRELAAYRIHSHNNFVNSTLAYGNFDKVRTFLDDFYRRQNLLSDTCRAAGFAYRRQAEWEDYAVLKGLAVAHRWGLQGRHFNRPETAAILAAVAMHVRHSSGALADRLRRAITLLLIAAAPRAVARGVIDHIDARRARSQVAA